MSAPDLDTSSLPSAKSTGATLTTPQTRPPHTHSLPKRDAVLVHNAEVTKSRVLAEVRRICLALPETTERLSHGEPTFFVRGKRSFATVWDDHHGDGRFALICAAPAGMQAALVETDSERFFVPPYVGTRGWLGVRLDRAFDREEIAGILEDAYAEVAPPRLLNPATAEGAAGSGYRSRT